jgi:outer membrane protein insertion porin family
MTRPFLLILPALMLAGVLAPAQSFQPKTIQFKGDPEYSDAELTAAAEFKKGSVLTAAEMNGHSKTLMDSGMFENITYTFNGQDLIFQLIPSTALYPLRFENLPLTSGKELDERLHARCPLYHGKVPVEGGLVDRVKKELEDELAAKGIQATISAAPYTDMSVGKVSAMNFTIISPPVRVGEIQLNGASAALAEKARLTAAKLVGSSYSSDGSASQLETSLGNFYGEQGYLDLSVHAMPGPAVADADGVHIPITVTVSEGAQYKLAGVKLTPDLVVTQAAFDKQSDLHNGDVVSLEKLRGNWKFLVRQYHNKGYMQARVLPSPALDHAQGTVIYTVTAEPGPVYTMGKLRVENVSDDLRAAIVAAWTVPAGAAFNEGAIVGMTATHEVNPALERVFATTNLSYSLNLHDDVRTVDVDLRLERKH